MSDSDWYVATGIPPEPEGGINDEWRESLDIEAFRTLDEAIVHAVRRSEQNPGYEYTADLLIPPDSDVESGLTRRFKAGQAL